MSKNAKPLYILSSFCRAEWPKKAKPLYTDLYIGRVVSQRIQNKHDFCDTQIQIKRCAARISISGAISKVEPPTAAFSNYRPQVGTAFL